MVHAKVVQRILKLLRLARDKGAAGPEAEAAMLQAQRLMAENGLTEGQVEERSEDSEEIGSFAAERLGRLQGWRAKIGVVVGRNFRCGFYVQRLHRGVGMMFLGRRSDVEIASEVYLTACENAYRRCQDFINENIDHLMPGYSGQERWANASKLIPHRKTFLLAYGDGLADRFDSQVKKTTGMALAVVPDKKVHSAMEEMDLKSVNQTRGSDDLMAHAQGFHEGKTFDPASKRVGS